MGRVISILSGRFHPFHKGHLASYNQLANIFGPENTYLGLSEKVEYPNSPFNVEERAKMAMCLGIPRTNILPIKAPYGSSEYVNKLKLDPQNTAMVFAVSQKDMGDKPRFTFENNSNMVPYPSDGKNLNSVTSNSYVFTTNTVPFNALGKEIENARDIRSMYCNADDNSKQVLLNELYGKNSKYLKEIFDNRLRNLNEHVVTYKINKLIDFITETKKYINVVSPQKKEILSSMIKESYKKIYQYSDYIPESLTPPDEFLNKFQLSQKEGNEVWWKNIMVGHTTGKVIDDRVEFEFSDDGMKLLSNTTRDSDAAYLPLDKVSVRKKI